MNTTYKVLVGIALVLSVLGLILPRYSALPLGGTTRDDIVLDVDSGRLTSGFALTVSGDESSFAGMRNSSGTTIGAGTTLRDVRCASVQVNLVSLANNASTSFDVTIANVATGTNRQAFWIGFNTSTLDFARLRTHVFPSSTAGTATVLVHNDETGATLDFGIVSSTVCMMQSD